MIDFNSIPEEGTTFTFTFKLSQFNNDQGNEESPQNDFLLNENKLIFQWKPEMNHNVLFYKPRINYVQNLDK